MSPLTLRAAPPSPRRCFGLPSPPRIAAAGCWLRWLPPLSPDVVAVAAAGRPPPRAVYPSGLSAASGGRRRRNDCRAASWRLPSPVRCCCGLLRPLPCRRITLGTSLRVFGGPVCRGPGRAAGRRPSRQTSVWRFKRLPSARPFRSFYERPRWLTGWQERWLAGLLGSPSSARWWSFDDNAATGPVDATACRRGGYPCRPRGRSRGAILTAERVVGQRVDADRQEDELEERLGWRIARGGGWVAQGAAFFFPRCVFFLPSRQPPPPPPFLFRGRCRAYLIS